MSMFYTKPILLVRFPKPTSVEKLEKYYEYLEKKIGLEYHVLAIVESTSDEMRLEVFNALESQQIDIEKLKIEIKESFKNSEIEES